MRTFLIISAFVFIPLVFSGCNKNEDSSPSSTSSTGYGDLTGTIKVYSEEGRLYGNNDIQVLVDETNQSIIADTTGNWSILKVEEGIKNITFKKQGFSTYKLVDKYINKDHTTNFSTEFYKTPSFYVTNLKAQLITGSVKITGHITDITHVYGGVIVNCFVSDNSDVSKFPNKYKYREWIVTSTGHGNFNFTENISLSSLYNAGIPASSTIYLVAYTDYANQSYKDKVTGKTFYSSLSDSASNIVSITLP
jgi:hypothetical protein